MSEVFGIRSLLYWWGVLTATVFVKDWLKQLADFFRTSDTFTPDKIPFNILPGINSWIDGVGEYIRVTVKFDPNAPILTVGTFAVPGYMLAFFVGFLLIILVTAFVARAVKSPIWLDDFVALFVLYIVLRVVGHVISLATALPFANSFRDFVNNPFAAYLVIMALLLFLTFVGEGVQSKRAFWRALVASGLLSLFMYPHEVSIVVGYVLDALAQFGAGLANPANIPFAVAWGLVGMLLALHRLATPEGGGRSGGGGRLSSDATRANVEVEVEHT